MNGNDIVDWKARAIPRRTYGPRSTPECNSNEIDVWFLR